MTALAPNQVWTPTRRARETFPRVVRMVTVCGVHYRRVLHDGTLGHTEMVRLDEFGAWIAKHKAEMAG